MRRTHHIPVAVALAAALLLAAACRSRSGPPEAVEAPAALVAAEPVPEAAGAPLPREEPSPAVPVSSMRKARMQALQGQPWELRADRVDYSEGSESAVVADVEWILYDEEDPEKVVVRATAQGAEVDLATEEVDFRGKVVAVNDRGDRLTAQRLRWDGATQEFHGSEGVRFERGGSVVTGKEATATPDLRKADIRGDVRLRVVPGASEEVKP